MKEFEIELSNGIKISAKLEYGELIYGVTAIAIGKNNIYLLIPIPLTISVRTTIIIL